VNPGDTINESSSFPDRVTARRTLRLTRSGMYNETPTYHLNSAFSADSRYLVFASAREGGSALLRAELDTGALTVIAFTTGIGGRLGPGDQGFYVAGAHGGGFTGNHAALAQASNWVIARLGRSLRAYHLETFEERVLIPELGEEYRFGNPSATADGKKALVTRLPAHPDRHLKDGFRHYAHACVEEFNGMPTTWLEIDLASGECREVQHEDTYGCAHTQPCPTDPDLWLIDRDAPPLFWMGGDHGKTSRAWLLNIKTRKLTEIRPRCPRRFQIHALWNRDGSAIFYHGQLGYDNQDGHYIGVTNTKGKVLWEREFPHFHYGHLGTHTQADAIITDGLITPDLITAIYYTDLDATDAPRLEILAAHDTQWGSPPGQYSHPHPHVSPDGRWLSYNRSENGRSDVYVCEIGR
jgi:hypothetical protein